MKITSEFLKQTIAQKFNDQSDLKRISKKKLSNNCIERFFKGQNCNYKVLTNSEDSSILELNIVQLELKSTKTTNSENIKKTFDPAEWFFYLFKPSKDAESDEQYVYFVKKSFWNKNFYFDDQSQSKLTKFLEKYGFFESMESCYEYSEDGENLVEDIVKARDILLSLGFIENPDLNRGECSILYPKVNKKYGVP